MARDSKSSRTAIHTKESTKTTGSMVLEPIPGNKDKQLTKAASRTGSGTGRVNGPQVKPNTQAVMLRASNKAMESCTSQVVTSIRVTLSTIRGRAMARCFGLMGLSTKETGREGFRMEKGRYT
jgi:hypothetical protein